MIANKIVTVMVIGFTTTHVISAYHHYSCEFESPSWRGCDKLFNVKYLPLFHHFKAIYQFPKHNLFGQNRS
jgi:hypothetical protein